MTEGWWNVLFDPSNIHSKRVLWKQCISKRL